MPRPDQRVACIAEFDPRTLGEHVGYHMARVKGMKGSEFDAPMGGIFEKHSDEIVDCAASADMPTTCIVSAVVEDAIPLLQHYIGYEPPGTLEQSLHEGVVGGARDYEDSYLSPEGIKEAENWGGDWASNFRELKRCIVEE